MKAWYLNPLNPSAFPKAFHFKITPSCSIVLNHIYVYVWVCVYDSVSIKIQWNVTNKNTFRNEHGVAAHT